MTTTARPAPAPATVWCPDRCPPAPFVLAGELCLPTRDPPRGAQHVLGGVHVVAPEVTTGHRATAVALLLPRSHGVVVRATAAWVWSGEPTLRPSRIDLALPPSAPGLPGHRPGPDREALPVRRTRWVDGSRWTRLAGVAVSDPTTTTAECARLLDLPMARRCVNAMVGSGLVDPRRVVRSLRSHDRARPSPPGTTAALALLDGPGVTGRRTTGGVRCGP